MIIRLRIFFFCLSFIILSTRVSAQNYLTGQVTIGRIEHQRIGAVLKKISNNAQFTFAYNNQTIPADSLISITAFNGTIYSFLSYTLGPDYEFKEVPGYIVLRHAPNKMVLNAAVDQVKDQEVTIRGQVINAAGLRPLRQVSIYEKDQLVSTLTDDQGRFELSLKNQNGPILLTASKENYRDTSLYFLQEVKVNSKKKKRYYKYYPDQAVNKLGRGFARFFIGSKQQIQSMNLGGFFAFSPYQVSLTPGLSSHGMYSGQVVDHFSLNVLGGYTAGVQGTEVAGLFNVNRWDVSSFQAAGLFNLVGGNMHGVQVGGVYNQVIGQAKGFHVAGLYNQISGKVSGFQVAGLANSTGDVNGLQVAGLLNVAKKVKGVQLAGLFNVADSSDYPVALINFIKNGRKSLSVSYDETQYIHVDYRSGGRVLYSLIGAGYNPGEPNRCAFDIGFGAHLINQHQFTLDGEYAYAALADFKKDPDQISSFRLLAGLKLSKRIQLFAGPEISTASYPASNPLDLHGWPVHTFIGKTDINNVYAGVTGGLQLTW
ncbi:hypothetical protein [Mucilaginibacter sp. dw_454]|uniref:hypothetical protein n=1 Tax=Mucilaginibacter sp. dw_454 TaxID=2720079 RepID=UPI001BD2B693|nr:hypothetical protein [Mucilaginibacter sp. dw_454]